ncbi:MAG: FecR family protein, partial [Pseudomonadota bacterium]
QKSFIVIKMEDNTKITLRPESSMVISEFQDDKDNESAELSLLKGGLRTVTGLIGKNKPDAVKLKTKVATIGIRGTDFIARLCGGDCLEEEKTYVDLDYADVNSPTLGPEINNNLPFGLYFLVKEGRIYVEQCPPGTLPGTGADSSGCPQIELDINQSGYAGAKAFGITPKVPLFLENDPHVEFSEIPESNLDALDVLQDESSDALQCEVTDV